MRTLRSGLTVGMLSLGVSCLFLLCACSSSSSGTTSGMNATSATSSTASTASGSTTTTTVGSTTTGGTTTGSGSTTTGTATLHWAAPTVNVDGSLLTNLAGYHVYYGTSTDALTQIIDVSGAASTTVSVDNLSAGTYYFSVVAYNSAGVESGDSNIASKTI